MGKKKRYIQRVKKFGTKMFKFLDKVDGTSNDILADAKIDNIIERIIVTDRGNQTIKLDARAIGANFAGKNITYTVNSLTPDDIAVNATGTGLDKFRFPSAEPAVDGNGDVIELAPGTHKVTAVIGGAGETAPLVTKTFNIARSEIVIGGLASAFKKNNNAGQVDLDLGEITVSGRRPFEEDVYDPTNAGKDSFIISCVDSNGDAVALVAAKTTLAENAGRTDDDTGILAPAAALAAGESETFTFTFTPRTAANVAITADAVSVDVKVERPE